VHYYMRDAPNEEVVERGSVFQAYNAIEGDGGPVAFPHALICPPPFRCCGVWLWLGMNSGVPVCWVNEQRSRAVAVAAEKCV